MENKKFLKFSVFHFPLFIKKMFSVKKIIIVAFCLLCLQTARAGEWTAQKSGTLAWLRDVYFTSESKGFVAGSNGTFLATSDGGRTWAKQNISTSDSIEQIHFADENTGWLLCRRNQFNRGADASSYLMKTTDGGATWERKDFGADVGRERIARIFSAKNGSLIAVGESGVLLALQEDGKTWKRTASPVRYLLLDGAFADDFHAAIAGAGATLLFSEDAGATWNKAMVYGDARTKFNRVFFVNKNAGWTVGGGGAIYQTVNGGKSWRPQISNVSFDLTDVFFLDTANGWAVGDGGTILHTTTGGNVWTQVASDMKHKIERVFFVAGKGFAVGSGGAILSFDKTKSNDESAAKTQPLKRSN